MSKYRRHLVIPDTQCKPGVPLEHLRWAGEYAVKMQPDVIVHLGDHWDMPSLSSYEKDTQKVANARDVLADIESGNAGIDLFMAPIRAFNKGKRSNKRYKPRLILLRGNHDGESNGGRIGRAVDAEPWLAGFFEAHPLKSNGWEVVPFLQPITVDGVAYSHFFPRSANGHVMQSRRGAPNAKLQVQREARSCTAGHKQGLDVHIQPVGGGRKLYGIIAGSFYQHEESYLTPQGNAHWNGLVLKNEVRGGEYDPLFVSMDYLRREFA